MPNLTFPGEMKDTFKKTYLRAKNAVSSFHPNATISVGARLQGNQGPEIIITQDGHVVDAMPGNHSRQTFNMNLICFDKSYVTAAEMADTVVEQYQNYFSEDEYAGFENGQNSDPQKQYTFIPRSQLMYYTDEDDFAVAVKIDVIVTHK